MKKLLLLPLLLAATTLFAEPKVETFDTKDGTATNTYVTSVTTKECQQASWTFFSGGILKNLGDMGSSNYAAVIRAKKSSEDVYPYLQSSTIEGGIDSLWFTWNSNGNETGGTWNVKIYINDNEVGAVTGDGGPKAASPFKKFGIGKLNITGDFTIKFVNMSPYDGTSNFMRFVIDDLSWEPKAAPGEKSSPTFEYADESLLKKIDAAPFTNTLTTNSDATATYESSVPAVATVAANGEVTIVGVGTTVITAKVAETETYKAAQASYTLRVVPLNFHMETFDGAQNVDLSTNNTYLTTPTESFNASTATGIKWTTLLGSVRNSLGGSSASNLAAAVRAKKDSEENYGYLLSSTISGGIDSLAFEWNANGSEASRTKNWDIDIFVNDTKVGSINDKGAAVQAMGNWFRFGVGNLKVDGDFTIKIVNNNVPDDGSSNHYRWVMDNLEWYSYEAPKYAVTFNPMPEHGLLGVLNAGTPLTSGDQVKAGTVLTIVPTPGDGYEVDVVSVNGTPVEAVEGVYSYTMTDAPAEISATFKVSTATGIDNTAAKRQITKQLIDGRIVITVDGNRYDAQGLQLK